MHRAPRRARGCLGFRGQARRSSRRDTGTGRVCRRDLSPGFDGAARRLCAVTGVDLRRKAASRPRTAEQSPADADCALVRASIGWTGLGQLVGQSPLTPTRALARRESPRSTASIGWRCGRTADAIPPAYTRRSDPGARDAGRRAGASAPRVRERALRQRQGARRLLAIAPRRSRRARLDYRPSLARRGPMYDSPRRTCAIFARARRPPCASWSTGTAAEHTTTIGLGAAWIQNSSRVGEQQLASRRGFA